MVVLPGAESGELKHGDGTLKMHMIKLEESTKHLNKNWQAFLYLIIEKASCIDDSHFWEYYYLVNDKKQLVGLCTIFNNYLR